MFKEMLKNDDRDQNVAQIGGRDIPSGSMSKTDFKKEIKKNEKFDKKDDKKKEEKGAPSIHEVRQSLHDMCYFHDQNCQKSMPCVYPLTGAISLNRTDLDMGSDDDDSDGSKSSSDGGGDSDGDDGSKKQKKRRGRYNYRKK